MVTSRWDNQNFTIRNWGMVLTGLLSFLTASLPIIYPTLTWLMPAFAVPTGIIGTVITIFLMRKYPNRKLRVLLLDHEEIERNFRLLFKENGIRYFRKTEEILNEKEDAYSYDFSGRKLSMTLKPYGLFTNVYEPLVPVQAATEIQLYKVTPKNLVFAEKLAELIDEMAHGLAEDKSIS